MALEGGTCQEPLLSGCRGLVGMLYKSFELYKVPGQIIATSAEVTPNGGLVRESPSKSP